MKRQLPFELVYQIGALVISIILVHLVYVTLIRPNADAILQQQAELAAAGEPFVQDRSLYVVLRDYEQESCFILMFWAIAIMGFKTRAALSERSLLNHDLIHVSEGMSILPEDTREYARPLQNLPDNAPGNRCCLVPCWRRCIAFPPPATYRMCRKRLNRFAMRNPIDWTVNCRWCATLHGRYHLLVSSAPCAVSVKPCPKPIAPSRAISPACHDQSGRGLQLHVHRADHQHRADVPDASAATDPGAAGAGYSHLRGSAPAAAPAGSPALSMTIL